MLNWNDKDKFSTLDDRLSAAAVVVVDDCDGEHCSDPLMAQAIIDAFSLVDARAEVLAMIDALAKAKRDSVVAAISPAEMASWPIKRAEAAAFDGTDASAPFLSAEAAARGVATEVLVEKVRGKGAALSGLEAAISGVSGRHCDAVKALDTFAAIAAYDFTTGWPV